MSRSQWLQKSIFIVVTCFAAMLLSVTSAQALTIVVDDMGDNVEDTGTCTLREAVAAFNTQAASGATAGECGEGATFDATNDTVDLTGLSGTITLTGSTILIAGGPVAPNQLTTAISIVGPGPDTLTIDGDGMTARVFEVDDVCPGSCDFDVLISGLTVMNGGGIEITDSDSNLTLDNAVITGNTAPADGGGVYNGGGDLTITNSTISNNNATGGGSDGGGVYNSGVNLTITNTTISGNMAGDEGGGICNEGGGTATISESTISGNTSTVTGGGIRIDDPNSTATITNSTISGNTSGTDGGGISLDANSNAAVTLLNVTIVKNSATNNGGGIDNEQGGVNNTFNVANSIIAANTAGSSGPDCHTGTSIPGDGPVITGGNNFIGDDTGCDNGDFVDGTLNDQVGTSGSPINPQLAALADNSTATHAPWDGSPVIDGVDNSIAMPPALDQRGVARPQGATDTSDIGAVQAACGDGTLQGTEECDAGKNNSDSTADACRTDCTNATCGDGVVDTGEECDDGNNTAGDGCAADCTNEVTPACGDGILQAGEQCDDGNTTSGDGCSSTCQTEAGAVCGNNVVEGSEECDDGNTTAGDGCSDTCTQEDGGGGGCSISAMASTSAVSGLLLLGTAIALLGVRRRRG